MATTNQFRIRLSSSAGDDAEFINRAFDSTLGHLASVGSEGMWGKKPFTERDGFVQETIESIKKSEDEKDCSRIFIAEAGAQEDADGGEPPVRVGMATIREDDLPKYLTELPSLKPELDGVKDFLWLEVILSDFSTGSLHKGAGAALLEAVKTYGRERKKSTLYVDAWAGNGGKLNRYYEQRGFTKVHDFSFPRASGDTWLGTLFSMDLSS